MTLIVTVTTCLLQPCTVVALEGMLCSDTSLVHHLNVRVAQQLHALCLFTHQVHVVKFRNTNLFCGPVSRNQNISLFEKLVHTLTKSVFVTCSGIGNVTQNSDQFLCTYSVSIMIMTGVSASTSDG